MERLTLSRLKSMIAEYEHSLQLVQKRLAELREQKRQPSITPKLRDDLEYRIRVLCDERRELKWDIADLHSYLCAWEGAAAS